MVWVPMGTSVACQHIYDTCTYKSLVYSRSVSGIGQGFLQPLTSMVSTPTGALTRSSSELIVVSDKMQRFSVGASGSSGKMNTAEVHCETLAQ